MSPKRAAPVDASVDAFLAHASLERNLSPRTVEAYGRDLARFNRFLEVSTGRQTLEYPVAAWQAAGIDEGTQKKAQEGIIQLLDLFLVPSWFSAYDSLVFMSFLCCDDDGGGVPEFLEF